ncbi:hypothetical protein BH20GEM1_BH20GEM1_13140 [soil metagenome]
MAADSWRATSRPASSRCSSLGSTTGSPAGTRLTPDSSVTPKRRFGTSGGGSATGKSRHRGSRSSSRRSGSRAATPRWRARWSCPPTALRIRRSSSDAIRFLVLVGAPATSPARQEIQRAHAKAEAEGLTESDVEAVGRLQELSLSYGHTGRGWEEYAAARAAAEGRPWLRWVWSPREPVLALWGEHDVNVDPEVHRSIFEVALEAQVATSRASGDVRDRIAPGVWRTMVECVRERARGSEAAYRIRGAPRLD